MIGAAGGVVAAWACVSLILRCVLALRGIKLPTPLRLSVWLWVLWELVALAFGAILFLELR